MDRHRAEELLAMVRRPCGAGESAAALGRQFGSVKRMARDRFALIEVTWPDLESGPVGSRQAGGLGHPNVHPERLRMFIPRVHGAPIS